MGKISTAILSFLLISWFTGIITGAMYLKFGWFKFIYHDKFGWHLPRKDIKTEYDGCNNHNICKYCGKHILQDSQGGWFSVEDYQ